MNWQDTVRRDRAFNAARKAFLEDGIEPNDLALLRCLKHGKATDLSVASRKELLKDHPQDFIDKKNK